MGHDYKSVVTAPTCTEQGYTTYTCTRCDSTYKDTYVNALGHSEVTIPGKEATCTTDGLTEGRKCSVCGTVTVKQEVIKATGHDYKSTVTAPTCTEQGYTTHTCTRCGDTYKDTYVDALGHNYSETWRTGEKEHWHECERCYNVKDKAIHTDENWDDKCDICGYAMNHTHHLTLVPAVEATCTKTGNIAYYTCSGCEEWFKDASGSTVITDKSSVIVAALGHDYKSIVTDPTCTEKGYTTHTCTRCADTYKDTYVNALGHTGGTATCKDKAVCTRCGVAYGNLNKSNHAGGTEVKNAKEATCTTAGYTGDTYCKGCGAKISTGTTIPAKGHSYGAWTVTKAATCTEKGSERRDCANCDHFENREVDALGHDYKSVVTAPTCTEKGYTTYTCTRCGDSYADTYVEALGHDYKTVITPPTCTEDGYTTHTCTRCNDSYVDTEVPALGHTWDEGVVTLEPTEETDGIRIYTCTVCGENKEEIIPSLKHTHEYTAAVTEPTCTEKGYTTHTCRCGDSYVDTYVDALGHSFVPTVVEPTYTHKGYTEYVCDRCGESYVDENSYTDPLGLPEPILNAENDPATGKPVITWEADGEADHYEICRSTSKTKGYKSIGTTGETAYQDESASAGKTYYYKVKAICAADEALSSDQSKYVTVKCLYPRPVAEVSNNSSGYPVIKWEKISGAKKYDVYYSTEEDGDYKKLTSTSSTSYTHSKAASGKSYYYQVRAYGSSSSYAGAFSNIVSGVKKLAVPSLTVTTNNDEGTAKLTWKKITGASGYELQCSINGGEFQTIEIVNGTSYTYVGMAVGSSYTFRLSALCDNAEATSDYSAEKTVSVKCGKPVLTIESDEAGKPVLTWEPVEGATTYEIQMATSSKGKYKTLAEVTGTEFVHVDAATGKTCYYKVRAIDANGNAGDFCSYKSATAKCEAPANVEVTNNASGYPVIKWEKVDVAKKYEVYYSETEDGTYKKLTTTSSASYTHSKAASGKGYFYKVCAYGASTASTGAFSEVVYGVRKLAVPSITVTTNNDAGTAKITWKKITGAISYELQLSINGGEFKTIEGINGTSYTYVGMKVGNSYAFHLRAVSSNADASSDYSVEKTVFVKCAKPVLTATNDETGKPVLAWEAIDGAAEYEIQMATSSKGKYKQLAIVTDPNFVHADAERGKTYYYKVRAIDENGNSGEFCSYKSATCKCEAPVITEVTTNSSGYPMIKWDKVEGAKKYEVWYSTTEDGTYKKLTTTSSTSYTYSKAKMDTEYFFKVCAYGASTASMGEFSEIVSGIRKLAQPSISLTTSQSNRKVTIKWKKVTNAKSYELQVSINGGEFKTIFTDNKLSFVHENLVPGNQYTYRVRAIGEKTSSDYCAEKSATIKVGKPTLSITLSENGKPQLSWEAVDGAVEYQVYYATSKKGKFKLVETTGELSFIYEEAKSGKTCYFKVRAVDINGNTGEYSSVKSIKSK